MTFIIARFWIYLEDYLRNIGNHILIHVIIFIILKLIKSGWWTKFLNHFLVNFVDLEIYESIFFFKWNIEKSKLLWNQLDKRFNIDICFDQVLKMQPLKFRILSKEYFFVYQVLYYFKSVTNFLSFCHRVIGIYYNDWYFFIFDFLMFNNV